MDQQQKHNLILSIAIAVALFVLFCNTCLCIYAYWDYKVQEQPVEQYQYDTVKVNGWTRTDKNTFQVKSFKTVYINNLVQSLQRCKQRELEFMDLSNEKLIIKFKDSRNN